MRVRSHAASLRWRWSCAPRRLPPSSTSSVSSTPSGCFATPDAEIQKLAKQVRDLQALLDKDGSTMAESDRRNKERDLANQSRDLQRMQREFREDLNLRRNEELAGIQERANKVIQQIAADEKFDLILQDPVVYASQRIDITDKVIKALADK